MKIVFIKFEKMLATVSLLGIFVSIFGWQVIGQKPIILKEPVDAETVENTTPQTKISADLLEKINATGKRLAATPTVGKQKVIIQYKDSSADLVSTADFKTKFINANGKINKQLRNVGLITAELPLSEIQNLSKDSNIEYISPDRELEATGHIETTTGASLVRSVLATATNTTKLEGNGIGIAVIDSGMHAWQDSIVTRIGVNNYSSPVLYQKDFLNQYTTGDIGWLSGLNWAQTTNDEYGHGTHVASLISGQSTLNNYYRGIAPKASLINLRVLDSYGKGSASNLVAAIDWAIANKTAFNIRVINLSLGTVAKDSYKTDPLCLAARRAVNAGIVVVASAGNLGKSASGQKYYGSISSPGIEPSVITVGASNTFGTDIRSDDTVATYSSRGPTRGFQTVNGIKKYDNLMKPDLVAPGNKIIGGVSYHTSYTRMGRILEENPSLYADTIMRVDETTGLFTVTGDEMMYLSGTSMSAPIVSGAAALLLQANPTLTPNMVKAILMYSAQPLKNYNTFEQGAGELNIDGAVRIARLIKSNASTLAHGTAMLNSSLPTAQTSTIAGQTAYWGKGVISNYTFVYGNALMTNWQAAYKQGNLLTDAIQISNGTLVRNTNLITNTVNVSRGAIAVNGVLASDGVLAADGVLASDGVLAADGVLVGDGVLAGDGVLVGDNVPSANDILFGDPTACMMPH
jgi:serine protease AprX